MEQTGEVAITLRRYVHGVSPGEAPDDRHRPCKAQEPWTSGYRPGCDASSDVIERRPVKLRDDGVLEAQEPVPRDHDAWPAVCAHCGVPFDPDDVWQTNQDVVYRVVEVVPGAAVQPGDEYTWRTAPPGAMVWAHWAPEWRQGFDGRSLLVKLPNGLEWSVDSEANNCTRKGDRTHRCWVREGEPPNVTVGKSGETCAAGAGSILSGNYHGFLRDGVLT